MSFRIHTDDIESWIINSLKIMRVRKDLTPKANMQSIRSTWYSLFKSQPKKFTIRFHVEKGLFSDDGDAERCVSIAPAVLLMIVRGKRLLVCSHN